MTKEGGSMADVCSCCGKESKEECNIAEKVLYEVLTFKQKVQSFLGFPSVESHTVQGWKLKRHDNLVSRICISCQNEMCEKHKEKCPTLFVRLKKVLYCEGGVIIALLLAFVLPYPVMLTIVLVIAVIVGLIVCAIMWADSCEWTPKHAALVFHNKNMKVLENAAAKEYKKQLCPLDESKDLTTVAEGDLFSMAMTDVRYAAIYGIEKNREYGEWSYFRYFREFAYSGQLTVSLKQGAENLKVEHLGIFLDRD